MDLRRIKKKLESVVHHPFEGAGPKIKKRKEDVEYGAVHEY